MMAHVTEVLDQTIALLQHPETRWVNRIPIVHTNELCLVTAMANVMENYGHDPRLYQKVCNALWREMSAMPPRWTPGGLPMQAISLSDFNDSCTSLDQVITLLQKAKDPCQLITH